MLVVIYILLHTKWVNFILILVCNFCGRNKYLLIHARCAIRVSKVHCKNTLITYIYTTVKDNNGGGGFATSPPTRTTFAYITNVPNIFWYFKIV